MLNSIEVIITTHPNYAISKLGQVRCIKRNQFLATPLDLAGYKKVSLWKNNKGTLFLLHRLIALAFIPNPHNYPCINHIDGNKLNNSIDNLEWCTYAHNNQHAYDMRLRAAPHTGKKTGVSSKYRYVTAHRNKWRIKIKDKGTIISQSTHNTEEEAALAADEVIKKHSLNKPLNFV